MSTQSKGLIGELKGLFAENLIGAIVTALIGVSTMAWGWLSRFPFPYVLLLGLLMTAITPWLLLLFRFGSWVLSRRIVIEFSADCIVPWKTSDGAEARFIVRNKHHNRGIKNLQVKIDTLVGVSPETLTQNALSASRQFNGGHHWLEVLDGQQPVELDSHERIVVRVGHYTAGEDTLFITKQNVGDCEAVAGEYLLTLIVTGQDTPSASKTFRLKCDQTGFSFSVA